jgi:hypothetical protein
LGLETGQPFEPIGDLVAGQGIVRRKFQRLLDSRRIVIASQGVFPSLQVGLASGQVETWVVGIEIQADIAYR